MVLALIISNISMLTNLCFSWIRLFSNKLMMQFNLKGKGEKDKYGLENTKVFSVIKCKPTDIF